MSDLQKQTGMAILLITHDMGIVNQMADDLCIMYGGRIAEYGSREQIFRNMSHPYTKLLFSSIPKLEKPEFLLDTVPGLVPSATEYSEGCRFANRCPAGMEVCQKESAVHTPSHGHQVTCHLLDKGINSKWDLKDQKIPINKRIPDTQSLISIKNLKTYFPVRKGIFLRTVNHIRAVDDVSLELAKGSTVALVGESGCGKTTLGESILKLNAHARGEVIFSGQDVMKLSGKNLKEFRKNMQMVFQDPFGSLQPRMTIEAIIAEGLEVHYPDLTQTEKAEKISRVMQEVGLSTSLLERYPHEFSGGQRSWCWTNPPAPSTFRYRHKY
jgi:peptide/nickel transport system ATP-binding protein